MANRNTSSNINLGIDAAQFQTDIQQVTASLERMTKAMNRSLGAMSKGVATETTKVTSGLNDMEGGANLAGASLMNMGSLISDLPYGFRGIANNLSYMGQLFSMLITKTGSFSAAMGSLWKAMMGPMGILLAVNAVIAGIDAWIGNGAKAKKSVNELTTGISNQHAEAAMLIEQLKTLTLTENERIAAIEILKEKHGIIIGQYKTQKEYIDALTASHELLIESMIAEAAMDVYSDKMKLSLKQTISYKTELGKLNQQLQTNADESKKLAESGYDITEQNKKGFDILSQIQGVEAKISWEKEKQRRLGLATIEAQKDILVGIKPEKVIVGKVPKKDNDIDAINRKTKLLGQAMDIQKEMTLHKMSSMEIDLRDASTRMGKTLFGADHYDLGYSFGSNISKGMEDGVNQISDNMATIIKPIKDDFKQLGEQLNVMIDQYIVSAFVSMFEMVGEAMYLGKDAFKEGGDQMLESFADFLSKLGGLLIALGVALTGVGTAIKLGPAGGPIALAAGIAAVTAAGAIKGYLKKKAAEANPLASSGGGGGYSDNSNQELIVFTRLDGRDMVISGQRSEYAIKR